MGFTANPRCWSSLGQEISREDATNPKTYSVLVSTNGVASEVPISKVWYDPGSHQATLRVAQRIYLFHPWQLVVQGVASNLSSDAIGGNAGRHRFVTDMNSHSLRGPSWDSPGLPESESNRCRPGRLRLGPRKWHAVSGTSRSRPRPYFERPQRKLCTRDWLRRQEPVTPVVLIMLAEAPPR